MSAQIGERGVKGQMNWQRNGESSDGQICVVLSIAGFNASFMILYLWSFIGIIGINLAIHGFLSTVKGPGRVRDFYPPAYLSPSIHPVGTAGEHDVAIQSTSIREPGI